MATDDPKAGQEDLFEARAYEALEREFGEVSSPRFEGWVLTCAVRPGTRCHGCTSSSCLTPLRA